jgi:ubiquinone/menaquinone biosynthesis C-methylase UbiE
MMAPFGQAMLDSAALRPGERVLDVGCGHATTIEVAERVAPHGTVLGVDISPEMLVPARRRADGVDNVALLVADAQVHPFEPGSFDAVISRFGTMFFDDPAAGSPTYTPRYDRADGWCSCAGGTHSRPSGSPSQ